MKYLAPGVWRLKEFPRPTINVYLAEDVLIDAGRSWDQRRIFAELEGREISLLALTHVHPDHQGVRQGGLRGARRAARLPRRRRRRDGGPAPGAGGGDRATRSTGSSRAIWEGPPHKVDRVLQEGDEVAGFRVVHAPGHARGEVIFFRDSDRVAICGDVIRNMSYATGLPGIARAARRSSPTTRPRTAARSASSPSSNPSLILPGHGPAVTDMAAFERFVAALPG